MAPFWRLMMWILALRKQRPTDQKGSSTLTTAIFVLTDADAPSGVRFFWLGSAASGYLCGTHVFQRHALWTRTNLDSRCDRPRLHGTPERRGIPAGALGSIIVALDFVFSELPRSSPS
jgi:hypothetical protein